MRDERRKVMRVRSCGLFTALLVGSVFYILVVSPRLRTPNDYDTNSLSNVISVVNVFNNNNNCRSDNSGVTNSNALPFLDLNIN